MNKDSHIFGLQIVSNDLLPETVRVPTKKYKFRTWMSDAHFIRIQKKWNKRYGYHDDLYFIRAGNYIMANSKVVVRIAERLNKRRTI